MILVVLVVVLFLLIFVMVKNNPKPNQNNVRHPEYDSNSLVNLDEYVSNEFKYTGHDGMERFDTSCPYLMNLEPPIENKNTKTGSGYVEPTPYVDYEKIKLSEDYKYIDFRIYFPTDPAQTPKKPYQEIVTDRQNVEVKKRFVLVNLYGHVRLVNQVYNVDTPNGLIVIPKKQVTYVLDNNSGLSFKTPIRTIKFDKNNAIIRLPLVESFQGQMQNLIPNYCDDMGVSAADSANLLPS